jgi:hypothetical protein
MKKTIIIFLFSSFLNAALSQTTLWSENFEGATANVTVLDADNSGTTWIWYSDMPNAHGGSDYMGCDYNTNSSPNNDELLTSTSVACPAGQTITWSFWAKSLQSNYPEAFVVRVSTNNGSTWTTVATVTAVPSLYTNYSYNLSAYAGQSLKIKIVCVSNNQLRLCVDDLSLVATPVSSTSVTTASISSIAYTSATSGGNVTTTGTAVVVAKGVCWSTSPNPTTINSITSNGAGTGSFVSNMTGLSPKTTYYVRAYATSSVSTSYGSQITFSTLDPCTADPQVYLTNLGFLEQTAANNLGASFFTNYSLPTTLSYNSLNPLNLLDLGKPVRFKVRCANNKTNQLSITAGECVIRTSDPNIIITDSTAGLNNVSYNSEEWSSNEFEIKIANTITSSYTGYFDFIVKEGANQYVSKCIPLPIRPFNSYFGTSSVNGENFYLTKDDSTRSTDCFGNGNGIVEMGERIETRPAISNASEFAANYVACFFKNLDGLSKISILTNTPGVNNSTIKDKWWYNYVNNTPQQIPAASSGTAALHKAGEFDFVFDYKYSETYSFDLHLIVAGGFKLFGPSRAPVLMNSSAKISFNSGKPPVPYGTGLQDVNENNKFTINPNPSSGLIKINYPNFLNEKNQYSIRVKNLLGQNLYSSAINNNSNTIDLSTIGTTGIYFIEIIDNENNTISSKKIILE